MEIRGASGAWQGGNFRFQIATPKHRGDPPRNSRTPYFFGSTDHPYVSGQLFGSPDVHILILSWRFFGGRTRRPQVPPQHLGDSLFLEGEELRLSRERQRQYFRAVCKRKLGGETGEVAPAPRKRRRVKTYVLIMSIDNVLRVSTGARLTDFMVEKSPTGELQGDPFTWRSLSLATDSGPDCVCILVARFVAVHDGSRSSCGCVCVCFLCVCVGGMGWCHQGSIHLTARCTCAFELSVASLALRFRPKPPSKTIRVTIFTFRI